MAEKNDVAMVFNVDLHCEGCAQKVRKCLKHFTGVKSVKTDRKSNRVTVTGNVDAAFVKRILEEKTKQKVDFQSPSKSDGESEKKKAEGKKSKESPSSGTGAAKKADGESEKKNSKQAPATVTVILKTDVHCEGCATKMTKIIRKYKGVKTVNVELSKDQIVITGTMDMKQMLPYLKAKLKKTVVEVVEKSDKKTKEEDKKPAPGAGDENGGKVESVNRMEYYGYPYGYGGVWYNHQAPAPVTGNGYMMEYGNPAPAAMPMPPSYLQVPQMFSDENPNSCSVM